MSKWQSKEQLIQLLSSLVEIPSITGTEAEVILPDFLWNNYLIYSISKKIRTICKNPTGDGRYFVTALVKKSDRTKIP